MDPVVHDLAKETICECGPFTDGPKRRMLDGTQPGSQVVVAAEGAYVSLLLNPL